MTRRKRPKIDLSREVPPRSGDMEQLFSTPEDAEQAAGVQLLAVRVDAIRPDPQQPRRTFPEESLRELADSIRQDGVIQPIEVTQVGTNNYMIVHGERRWRAAQLLELPTIPAVVRRRDYDSLTRFVRQLVENIQREDLNDVDRAAGLLHLRTMMANEIAAQVEAGLTDGKPHSSKISWSKVGQRLGYSRQRIHQLIQLLKLPDEIKESVRQGAISERETRVYHGLRLPQQRELHSAFVESEIGTEELREAARRLKERPELPVSEAVREAKLFRAAPGSRRRGPYTAPRSTIATRKAGMNLNRLHWVRDHLARIQLPEAVTPEEQEALLHLLSRVAADLEGLRTAVDALALIDEESAANESSA
jgi:ParB family chromosome partitioning protein